MKPSAKPYWFGIIIGAVLMASPLFGLLGTAYGMRHSLDALQDSGISDPRAFSSGISLVLYANVIGLVLCPVGVVVLVVSLVLLVRARRARPLPSPTHAP